MSSFIAKLIAATWNRAISRSRQVRRENGLNLGAVVIDGQPAKAQMTLGLQKRREHMVIVGRTGTGKTSFMLHACAEDVKAQRGFIFLALHGDVIPFVLSVIASLELSTRQDFSEQLIVIDPTDPEFSVGLNMLEGEGEGGAARIAEQVTEILRVRWHLDHFGARTEELLRNVLYVLALLGYTLLEVSPFLTQDTFRAACLKKLPDSEVKEYFEWRYNKASEAMRRVMNEPILNKISAFTTTSFRHIVGQPASTFSLRQAMDDGKWILVNLDKGFLGEHALTFGGLFLTIIKNSLFARKKHDLFTVYCDEVQNFVSSAGNLETILAEARKYGVGMMTAQQFLDQIPPEMRAAILAVGTHGFFQLSSLDAMHVSTALDGGKALAERLKNLRQRHMIVKTGHERWREVVIPTLRQPAVNFADLYNRSRSYWARPREGIDRMISKRFAEIYKSNNEALNGW
ncbi:MAG: hypothetical protein ABSD88_20740 [Candidatus Korobacteraceae bacterium]|jgi:hypothetical protein